MKIRPEKIQACTGFEPSIKHVHLSCSLPNAQHSSLPSDLKWVITAAAFDSCAKKKQTNKKRGIHECICSNQQVVVQILFWFKIWQWLQHKWEQNSNWLKNKQFAKDIQTLELFSNFICGVLKHSFVCIILFFFHFDEMHNIVECPILT